MTIDANYFDEHYKLELAEKVLIALMSSPHNFMREHNLRASFEVAEQFAKMAQENELGRLEIANDGTGTPSKGSYNVRSFGKRAGKQLREGRVENWSRLNRTVFALVRKALGALRYDY